MAFHSATYFDLDADFKTNAGGKFTASLVEYNGRKLPIGKDFDPATGKLKDQNLLLLDENAAKSLRDKLANAKFK